MVRNLHDAIKRTSMEAIDNAQICDLRYGTVSSVSPLNVQVTNLFTLPESLLIVPEHLTDYEIEITTTGYGWETDYKSGGSGDPAYESHNHAINQDKRTLKVHGALQVGDKVALLRKTGGQSYFILDRLPKDEVIA